MPLGVVELRGFGVCLPSRYWCHRKDLGRPLAELSRCPDVGTGVSTALTYLDRQFRAPRAAGTALAAQLLTGAVPESGSTPALRRLYLRPSGRLLTRRPPGVADMDHEMSRAVVFSAAHRPAPPGSGFLALGRASPRPPSRAGRLAAHRLLDLVGDPESDRWIREVRTP